MNVVAIATLGFAAVVVVAEVTIPHDLRATAPTFVPLVAALALLIVAALAV